MDPGIPNWGRIPALAVTGAPVLGAADAGHALRLPTTAGDLVVTLLEHGLRLRVGPPVRDYGILVASPAPLPPVVEAVEGGTRVTARNAAGGVLELRVGHAPFHFELLQDGRRSRGMRIAGCSPWISAPIRRSTASARSRASSTSAASGCARTTTTRSGSTPSAATRTRRSPGARRAGACSCTALRR
jgi:hypothetical protein